MHGLALLLLRGLFCELLLLALLRTRLARPLVRLIALSLGCSLVGLRALSSLILGLARILIEAQAEELAQARER